MGENFANSMEYSNPFALLIGFVFTMLMKIIIIGGLIQFKINSIQNQAHKIMRAIYDIISISSIMSSICDLSAIYC